MKNIANSYAYNTPAAQLATGYGLHPSTLRQALQAGKLDGEKRDGKWYTTEEAVEAWYHEHYRHADPGYSQKSGKTWTTAEKEKLRKLVAQGMKNLEIADILKKSLSSVKTMRSRLKIKTPKAGLRVQGEAPLTYRMNGPETQGQGNKTGVEENSYIFGLVAQAKKNLEEECPTPKLWDNREEHHEGRIQPRIPKYIADKLGAIANHNNMPITTFAPLAFFAALEFPELLRIGEFLAEALKTEPSQSDDSNRLRMHVKPEIKYMLKAEAKNQGLTQARFIIYSCLAVGRVPEMLDIGKRNMKIL